MCFDALIRTGVKTIDTLTTSLQATVLRRPWLRQTVDGTPVYAPTERIQALVDWKQSQVRTADGSIGVSRAHITFPRAMAALNNNDILVLPDGSIGPIMSLSGYMDPVTGTAFVLEVWVG